MWAHSPPAVTSAWWPRRDREGAVTPSQGCRLHGGTQLPRDTGAEGPSGAGGVHHLHSGAASPGACPCGRAGSCTAG